MEHFFSNMNRFLSNLLTFFGIKEQQRTSKDKVSLTSLFHPFSIYMHLATFYSLSCLLRCWIIETNKSVFSSALNCFLSFIIWHAVRIRGHVFHSLLKDSETGYRFKIASRKRYSLIITITAFFLCFLFPPILAFYFVIGVGLKATDLLKFWFVGHILSADPSLQNVLLFICVFVYASQQILFPSAFLLIFSVLNINHIKKAEKIKFSLKNGKFRGISFSKQSYTHKNLLLKVKKHEEAFSFLIFLALCFILSLGFTGMALLMKQSESQTFVICEGSFYLYFSVISTISITYSACLIQSHLQEIKQFYRMEYESIIDEGNWLNSVDEKKLKIIKMIYTREIPYLTAWNTVRLDKNLVFSVFSGLITYGFLIIQLKKD